MPPYRTSDPRPRREPLSCQSCRAKKLRCDRQMPCGNCRARLLTCEFRGERPSPTVAAPTGGSEGDVYAQNAALKTRIERLERAMFGDLLPTAETAETESMAEVPRNALPDPSVSSSSEKRHDGATIDSQWLENIGSHHVDSNTPMLNDRKATVHATNDFLFDADYLARMRPVSLPDHDIALECLDLYEAHIDLMNPIMHIPTARKMFYKVYSQLTEGHRTDPGSQALILMICSHVSSWKLHDALIPKDTNNAVKPTDVFATQALSAMENANVASQISIEGVQASVLLFLHFCHQEGFSPHTRSLHARAFMIARCLGLHSIDAPGSRPREESQADIIQAEVGRRIWWHIAGSDWMLGYTGGVHEGTYSIQPYHAMVKKPRNLNHEDLSVCDATFSRPEHEPTIMTYSIFRTKLAIICREIMDELQVTGTPVRLAPEEVPYDKIIALDTKYSNLVSNLPRLLQLDQIDGATVNYGRASTTAIWLMRTTIHLFLHARRCKFHLPYLLRARSDSRFAFSREMCLRSARKIREAHEALFVHGPSGTFMAHFHRAATLIHFFYAALVLVMDLCVNYEGERKDQHQVDEVQRIVQLMEEARVSSPFVGKFLDSVMVVLRKHHVSLGLVDSPKSELKRKRSQSASSRGGNEMNLDLHQGSDTAASTTGADYDRATTDELDNVLQDFLYYGDTLDLGRWDALVYDLEMQLG